MSPDQKQFLSLERLPARLSAEEASWFLGVAPHDLPVLVASGLLVPLGKPAPNAPRYSATRDLERLRAARKFLDRAARALQNHWLKKRRGQVSQRSTIACLNGTTGKSDEV